MLGIAIGTDDQANGTTTSEAITGGRNTAFANDTEVEYTKDFPGAYTFLNGTVLGADSNPGPYYTNKDFWGFRTENPGAWDATPYFYVVVANPKNAAVQPGKWAIFKVAIAANNQNRFTGMLARLGPAIGGIQNTTVGGVTFDPSIHGTYFGAEASVMLTNANGTPIMANPMHGAGALHRAYGAYREDVDTENYQKQVRLIYMDNIVGHGLRRDPSFRATGIMNIVTATRYYHVNHG
ncbi:MAG: hypothetical protein JWO94_261 [Verrucomicrobiaceae bacterium]|nr:hypothetical protein [Verrucomicrobiaceae bacterium]